jgi:hypothetical protein
MVKAYVVVSVARQISGENIASLSDYVGVILEKGYFDKEKANTEIQQQPRQYETTLLTPEGSIKCLCQRGIQEIEVE